MTIHARVVAARQQLRDAGVSPDEADLDARLLAEYLLGWTTERYFVDGNQEAPADFAERYDALVARRAAREPFAYIVGREEFWGLQFAVTPAVLIPRPETELIVEVTIELFPDRDAPFRMYDIGTGSGCIAIAIAHERPRAIVVAVDVSTTALEVARGNAERHGVSSRIEFRRGDLFAGLTGVCDLIVSNPPYVAERDRPTLQAEVGRFEPDEALFAGVDGLTAIRRLVTDAPARLRPGGHLVFEFGFGEADAVAGLISQSRELTLVELRHDLQHIPRTAITKRT